MSKSQVVRPRTIRNNNIISYSAQINIRIWQWSTTTHNDPQRPHNDPQRSTTIHNDLQTIEDDLKTTPKDPTTKETTQEDRYQVFIALISFLVPLENGQGLWTVIHSVNYINDEKYQKLNYWIFFQKLKSVLKSILKKQTVSQLSAHVLQSMNV